MKAGQWKSLGFLNILQSTQLGEKGRGLRRVYALFKPGRKHINLSHPRPAVNQRGIFTTPRKIYQLTLKPHIFQSLLLSKQQLTGQ
jgi:hypothetical protein